MKLHLLSPAAVMLLSAAPGALSAEESHLRGSSIAAFKKQVVELVAAHKKADPVEECPSDALFPNTMYDVQSKSCKSQSSLDLMKVEAAAFRLITAQAHRLWQANSWCPGSVPTDGGLPYKIGNFAVHAITLLDTIQQLQLVPQECSDLHAPLRDLLMPYASEVTFEYATGNDVDESTPSLEWWETEFLPTAASAFSCGFTDEDTLEDPSILPNDIREDFSDSTKYQQVWRLMKEYLRSPQKQREQIYRQQDFDVSLYVPFMGSKLSRKYLYAKNRGIMRTGANVYLAHVWFLWHSIAARYFDLEQQCHIDDDGAQKLQTNIVKMLSYFGLTHPCPYCRYHFLYRVSRNDQDWKQLPQAALASVTRDNAPASESGIYPLEYQMLGCNVEDKIGTIKGGESIMLFFWKMHNAVTSAVEYSLTCKDSELVEDGPFGCKPNGSDFRYEGKADSTTRNLGRAWPSASRFRFWLKEGQDGFMEARKTMEDAHAKLNELDREIGSTIREDYCTVGMDSDDDDVQAVKRAIEDLDQAMLDTNLLYMEYALEDAPNCDAFEDSIKSFEPLDPPLPLTDDGNFPFVPSACYDSDIDRSNWKQEE